MQNRFRVPQAEKSLDTRSKTVRGSMKGRGKSLKGPTRSEHYNWLKHTEIPKAKRKLAAIDIKLVQCKQEVDLLDTQMLAIEAMNGTKAYQATCRRHLDAKIKVDTNLSAMQKEKEKLTAKLLQLEATCGNLYKECKASSKCRKEIRQHQYYSGAAQASVSLTFNNARIDTSSSKPHLSGQSGA